MDVSRDRVDALCGDPIGALQNLSSFRLFSRTQRCPLAPTPRLLHPTSSPRFISAPLPPRPPPPQSAFSARMLLTLSHAAAIALSTTPTLPKEPTTPVNPAVAPAAPTPTLATPPSCGKQPLRSPRDDNSRKQQWIPGGGRAPSYLDGSLAGDRGFDPKCLVALARTRTSVDSGPWAKMEREARMVMCNEWEAKKKVYWMREAEMKHARLAMVAAAGWPISELLDKPISGVLGLASPLDATGGRAPSLLNGHLFDNGTVTAFLVIVAAATVRYEFLRHAIRELFIEPLLLPSAACTAV